MLQSLCCFCLISDPLQVYTPNPGDVVLIQYTDPLTYLGANNDNTLMATESSAAVFTEDKFKWSVEAAVSGDSEHLSFLNLATGGYLKPRLCTTGRVGGEGLGVSWILNTVGDVMCLKDSKKGRSCGVSVRDENDQEHLVERASSCWLATIRFIRTATNEPPEFTGITAMHNAERAVAGYEQLEWDENLATVATDYATQCTWSHNDRKHEEYEDLVGDAPLGVGENIYGTSSLTSGWDEAVSTWLSEKQCHVGNGRCGEDCWVCGHYTQMIFPGTTKLGCGYSGVCPGLFSTFSNSGGQMMVCNYYSAQVINYSGW